MKGYEAMYKTRYNEQKRSITVFLPNGYQKTFKNRLNNFDTHHDLIEKIWSDFWEGKKVIYSHVLKLKDLKRGYKFKAYMETE